MEEDANHRAIPTRRRGGALEPSFHRHLLDGLRRACSVRSQLLCVDVVSVLPVHDGEGPHALALDASGAGCARGDCPPPWTPFPRYSKRTVRRGFSSPPTGIDSVRWRRPEAPPSAPTAPMTGNHRPISGSEPEVARAIISGMGRGEGGFGHRAVGRNDVAFLDDCVDTRWPPWEARSRRLVKGVALLVVARHGERCVAGSSMEEIMPVSTPIPRTLRPPVSRSLGRRRRTRLPPRNPSCARLEGARPRPPERAFATSDRARSPP